MFREMHIEKPRKKIARLSFTFINAWTTRFLRRLHIQKVPRKHGYTCEVFQWR